MDSTTAANFVIAYGDISREMADLLNRLRVLDRKNQVLGYSGHLINGVEILAQGGPRILNPQVPEDRMAVVPGTDTQLGDAIDVQYVLSKLLQYVEASSGTVEAVNVESFLYRFAKP